MGPWGGEGDAEGLEFLPNQRSISPFRNIPMLSSRDHSANGDTQSLLISLSKARN